MTITVTSHRPNKLWGYNMSDPRYQDLLARFKTMLLEHGATDAWTGMALGADMVFAQAVLELRDKGFRALDAIIEKQQDIIRRHQKALDALDEILINAPNET